MSYRVHEFAELAGVTVKALHHYDRLGLLKPARTAAGYRVYTTTDLPRLEQIVALKTIGFSLKEIATILERDTLPLRTTFSQQRQVLEERRRLLDRAIQALSDAEYALESDETPVAAILQKVIKVMSANDTEAMRKYYTDEAWALWKHSYDDWPSPEWRALYRDIASVIGTDPADSTAQALADRWLALAKGDAVTAAVRTGLMKAWADRTHWPASLQRRLVEFDIERASAFINEAIWWRWGAEQQSRAQFGGPGTPRVTESRRALFQEWGAILDSDPTGERAQRLYAKWRALLDEETGGDKEIQADALGFIRRRQTWPAGMKRYIASLYATDVDTWERITSFIEQAGSR